MTRSIKDSHSMRDLNLRILRYFGLMQDEDDSTLISKAVITIEANKFPIVEVTQFLLDSEANFVIDNGQAISEDKRYELVAVDREEKTTVQRIDEAVNCLVSEGYLSPKFAGEMLRQARALESTSAEGE